VSWGDTVDLIAPAFGVMLLSAEGFGVARTLAGQGGYRVDANRDLVALGGSNFLAGLSQGFVQCGGSSQTMASERAGGKTQLASLAAAGLVLLTGAFLSFLFEDLPQATLGAIVVVAISRLFRVDELRRFARVRTSALVLALVALVGVLVLGVLPGLIVAAALSLVVLIQRLSRPAVGQLARDPESGAWGHVERHTGWVSTPDVLVTAADGPLFYANAASVKDRVLDLAAGADPKPRMVVLDLSDSHDLDVETLDTLADLDEALAADGIELRLAGVRASARPVLERSGLASRLRVEPTLDAAVPS
jgi:MFS superfamily sulfate permease-like transporter